MWPNKLKTIVDRATTIAMDCSHEYVTMEHLLLALMDEDDVLLVFINCNVNVVQLQGRLRDFLQRELSSIVVPDSQNTPKLTIGVKKLLERALQRSKDQDDIEVASILLEMFSEKDSHAVYFLQSQNLNYSDILDCMTENRETINYSDIINDTPATLQGPVFSIGFDRSLFSRATNNNAKSSQSQAQKESTEASTLQQYSVDLNAKALTNRLEPVLLRDGDIADVMRVLCCKKKNNVILVGEPGVGKTAIAEGVASAIAHGTSPRMLSKYTVYSLDIGSVLAGTKYRGDFEERIKTLMTELKKRDDVILFIDEIHSIIGAGATNGSSLDASNLLKPVLAQGSIRCIGTTTYKEYNQVMLKDKAFLRRFHKMDVLAPSQEATKKILMGIKSRYEKHHSVKYTNSAISDIVKYADRFMSNHNSNMPDKAVGLMDEIGAYYAIQHEGRASKNNAIKSKDVVRIMSAICKTPVAHMMDDDVSLLANMEDILKKSIYGQDHAVSAICDKMKLAKLGLQNANKPIGCFLFYGPTGVGKTELAKQLATCLQVKLLRFDMSEYSESHSVSRIVGSPPGYVGFEHGGLLTDAVYHNQHCVLLLDEIEKAHHNIYNMMLQVMDRGIITDNSGREVNFTHSVIIMTTNLGSESFDKGSMGFKAIENNASIREIERVFSPEFRNRLSGIIKFNSLTPISIGLVAEKNLKELKERLKGRGINLTISKDVLSYIIDNNKSMKNGARFLESFISSNVAKPIADLIMERKCQRGISIKVGMANSSIVVTCRDEEPGEKVSTSDTY